jgi:hypothetical protein
MLLSSVFLPLLSSAGQERFTLSSSDERQIIEDTLRRLIVARPDKPTPSHLNIVRGVNFEESFFPSKIGETKILLVDAKRLEQQPSFDYFEFERLALRGTSIKLMIERRWQSCSGNSGHFRHTYTYKRSADKRISEEPELEFFSIADGPSPCKTTN